MKTTQISHYELFKVLADLDIDKAIKQVFGGKRVFGRTRPVELDEAFEIFQTACQQSKLEKEAEDLLELILRQHLHGIQAYAKIRLVPQPNVDELLASYEVQVQSMERWQLFYRGAKRHGNIREAYQVAFVDFLPRPFEFETTEVRNAWVKTLLNEHDRNMAYQQLAEASTHKPSYWMDGQDFFGSQYHLNPTEAALLQLLLDQQFHTSESIIFNTLGTRASGNTERNKLSGNIYRLNNKLSSVWNKKRKWIKRQSQGNAVGYQLEMPQ